LDFRFHLEFLNLLRIYLDQIQRAVAHDYSRRIQQKHVKTNDFAIFAVLVEPG
jgi:hypothetical protein